MLDGKAKDEVLNDLIDACKQFLERQKDRLYFFPPEGIMPMQNALARAIQYQKGGNP